MKKIPLKRTGEAIEAAYGILFLASEESSYINATELQLDGGMCAT